MELGLGLGNVWGWGQGQGWGQGSRQRRGRAVHAQQEDVVRGEVLRAALLLEHEELRQDGDRLWKRMRMWNETRKRMRLY